MMDFLSVNVLWIKSLHLIAVIAWMAGLFYLPRLYVYHTQVKVGSDQDLTFQVMEVKLLRIIMNPAMIASWVFGLLFLVARGNLDAGYWLHIKLLAVLAMTGFHMLLARWRRDFAVGRNSRTERSFRMANEIPTILMLVIVFMAVLKPF